MSLDQLTIETVSIIATYGWPQRFDDLGEAIAYVEAISAVIGADNETPLDRIKVRIEFDGGGYEQCSFPHKELTVEWMRRRQEPVPTR